MASTSGAIARVVVDPVAAVVGLPVVVDRRDADGQRAPVGVQPVGQLLDERHPVRPRRRPRVLAVGEGELLVVDVDALRSRRRRRTRRWRRRARARCAGSARMPAITPVGAVEDRRHQRHAAPAGGIEELLGGSAGASGSISIVSTPVARNQNGDSWCSVSARASSVGQRVVERPVRRPGVDVEHAGRRGASSSSPPKTTIPTSTSAWAPPRSACSSPPSRFNYSTPRPATTPSPITPRSASISGVTAISPAQSTTSAGPGRWRIPAPSSYGPACCAWPAASG